MDATGETIQKSSIRECQICCGGIEPDRPKAIYCRKCSRQTTRARQKLEKATYLSKKFLGEFENKAKKVTCKNCSKEFLSEGQDCCCNKCKIEYMVNNAECRQCRVNLLSKGITAISWQDFCSEECASAFDKKLRPVKQQKAGRVEICFICGEEVVLSLKNQGKALREQLSGVYICKPECEVQRVELHKAWLSELVDYPCFMCGTSFKVIRSLVLNKFDHSIDYGQWISCGEACQELYLLDVKGINCHVCGTRFVKNGRTKYCSDECSDVIKAKRKAESGKCRV